MRKLEYLKKIMEAQHQPVLIKEYLPKIKEVWMKYGYDPDYLLDENDDFYNILEDYFKSKREIRDELKRCSFAAQEYTFQVSNDVTTYKRLYKLVKDSLCGFYNVSKHRYFTSAEVFPYTEWYLNLVDRGKHYHFLDVEGLEDVYGYDDCINDYKRLSDKYSAIFSNIAALLIAADVTQYLDEKKICDKSITKSNVDKFLQYGPQAGYIFDPETMEYRKPENFEEFTHHLHTQYWFYDPAKGYHIDAPYKWNPDVPMPEELT